MDGILGRIQSMRRKLFILIALMVAGEAVFLLTFVLPRVFRPTFLTVFDINNFQLGTAYSVYGTVAMFCYFLGGPIADRFSAKNLIIVALLLSSTTGAILVTIPTPITLNIMYGFWGMSTILLFWAAFIKTTRIYGGSTQGLAFGAVDAGRGLFVALLATVSIYLFSLFLPSDAAMASKAELTQALKSVIWVFSGVGWFSALLIWLALPKTNSTSAARQDFKWSGVLEVLRRPSIWYQSLIIMCAYVGYKCSDDFSLYAKDVLGFDDVEAATVGTISFWARAVGALVAGLLGDRFSLVRMVTVCFGLVIVGSALLSANLGFFGVTIVLINIGIASLAVYGLRGLYYSIFNVSNIPMPLTGTAVGVVAVIGYTPDIFFGPLMGIILDGNPGALGHQYLFMVLVGFGILGLLATYLFKKAIATQKRDGGRSQKSGSAAWYW
jgi:MFS family permease